MAKPENACLDALPSRKIYAAFEQNNGGKQTCTEISTWTTEIETILNNKLKGPYDAKQCAEKVANVWCYVSELTSKGEACKTICDFFYYWLGCTLVDILKYSHEFREIMNQIYGVLVKFPNTGKCETINTAPTTSTTFFKPRKIIFDYLYDCSIVNSCSESTGHNCTSAYSTYTEEVEQKYRMVCANCVIETGGDPCCRKLKQRGGTSIPPNLSDLTCPEVSDSEPVQQLLACIEQQQQQQEQQQEQVQFVGPASGGSVVPAAVSSAVGLVGLPALAFFLYKVQSTTTLYKVQYQ
ncbi:Variable surface protein Vir7-like protein [Plasmodium coatneyi]|uniref:Variable surface protein Vir7-like protein n=1 Tax=Plasmodium coatneyi TaxID=208452 RepID=A0A1B1DXR8_9APIC|nr:Variable surface protein Vir7-like protein [Plasmodium coatneyi]ANQ07573.1 Variable surface protein Vir7-like protein [Plasmodium coatneyi]